MTDLLAFLQTGVGDGLLPWAHQVAAAERFGLSCAQVEETALTAGFLPARYQRNRQTIDLTGQLALFHSRVAIIGCGGLGGYLIEELARLGVGTIVAIDPDVFEEHNLNRQLLCHPGNLGQPKVTAALARIAQVNPAVRLLPVRETFTAGNGSELLQGVQLAVDALDNIPARLALARVCADLRIPFVHGAIAGWYGHVASQFPGEQTVQEIYASWSEGKGIEQQLGNPAFTPAVVASLEAAEVCKILLGAGQPLRGRKLVIDLLAMEFHEVGV
ncbi:MAG TPA: HesA/MoeB/ThiF family protein [Geobacteraceae bacterium]